MARVGALYGIHRKRSNRVDAELVQRLRGGAHMSSPWSMRGHDWRDPSGCVPRGPSRCTVRAASINDATIEETFVLAMSSSAAQGMVNAQSNDVAEPHDT
jgi:hypothetical protein